MKVTDGRRKLDYIEADLWQALAKAEDKMSAYRLRAAKGLHPKIQAEITNLINSAKAVLNSAARENSND